MNVDDHSRLDLIRKSLYDPWGLRDIKETSNPRVAFVALVSWIDQVSRLSTGRKRKGEGAWRHFARRYLDRHVTDAELRLLYDGLRSAISHEYGTRGVALTSSAPERHWQIEGGLLLLDLGSLIAEYDDAFLRFLEDLENDPALQAIVLPHADSLLSPVKIAETNASTSTRALVTVDDPVLPISAVLGALSASATAPPGSSVIRDESGWVR